MTGWRGSAMAVRRAAITVLVCIGAIAATTSMFVRVAAAQGVPGFAIVFGGWAVLPYFALIAVAVTAIGRPFASLVIAVGSVFVGTIWIARTSRLSVVLLCTITARRRSMCRPNCRDDGSTDPMARGFWYRGNRLVSPPSSRNLDPRVIGQSVRSAQ